MSSETIVYRVDYRDAELPAAHGCKRWRTDRVRSECWRVNSSHAGDRATSNGIYEPAGVQRNTETPNAQLQRAGSARRNRSYATVDIATIPQERGDWRLLELVKDPRQGSLVRVRCSGKVCNSVVRGGSVRTRAVSVWLSPISLGWLACHRCTTAAGRWAARDEEQRR